MIEKDLDSIRVISNSINHNVSDFVILGIVTNNKERVMGCDRCEYHLPSGQYQVYLSQEEPQPKLVTKIKAYSNQVILAFEYSISIAIDEN